MDINKYLKRIKVNSDIKPDLETLRCLHRQHIYNVPFENLDIHLGKKIVLEKDKLLHKIIEEDRGGFCYELNGAFYELLTTAGFNVKRISAGVCDDGKNYSPDFDHMALIVNIDGEEFLADVGFGDSFIEPLKFKPDEIQKDINDYFRISKSEDKQYYVLFRSSDGENFIPQYRFTSSSRELNEYDEMCRYHQTSPLSHFTQKVICSMAVEKGRVSLSDLKFIKTENGVKFPKEITDAEFYSLLKKHFNISLPGRLSFPNQYSKA
jgi:N-hydroxyarylamine O-acetyltransferase